MDGNKIAVRTLRLFPNSIEEKAKKNIGEKKEGTKHYTTYFMENSVSSSEHRARLLKNELPQR